MVLTTTGVECSNCGLTSGHYEEGGNVRCDDCGQFARSSPEYCAAHDVNIRALRNRSDCPYCRREREVEARRQEHMARRADPRMHPTVDAKRF